MSCGVSWPADADVIGEVTWAARTFAWADVPASRSMDAAVSPGRVAVGKTFGF